MKEITLLLAALVVVYAAFGAYLYLFQRKLLYFPVDADPDFAADEVTVENDGHRLQGWVINPGQARAVIYFGGNSELVTHREAFFRDVFADFSVYLINYRGYGDSEGRPSERALLADALAIFDFVQARHRSIIAYGRSLGSGVAAYLAARRPLERVILLTPYDSIAEVAQGLYPVFPVRYLIRDRFDSASLASEIRIPVLIATAERDRVIPLRNSLALRDRFDPQQVLYRMIRGAAHNDIVEFADYRQLVREFIAPDFSPGGS